MGVEEIIDKYKELLEENRNEASNYILSAIERRELPNTYVALKFTGEKSPSLFDEGYIGYDQLKRRYYSVSDPSSSYNGTFKPKKGIYLFEVVDKTSIGIMDSLKEDHTLLLKSIEDGKILSAHIFKKGYRPKQQINDYKDYF